MPIRTAALTLIEIRAAVNKIPNSVRRTFKEVKSPRVTFVAGSATIIPELCRPINAIKQPIPTTIAVFSPAGTASIIS